MSEREKQEPAQVYRIAEIRLPSVLLFNTEGVAVGFIQKWGRDELTGELMLFVQKYPQTAEVDPTAQSDFAFDKWHLRPDVLAVFSVEPLRLRPDSSH